MGGDAAGACLSGVGLVPFTLRRSAGACVAWPVSRSGRSVEAFVHGSVQCCRCTALPPARPQPATVPLRPRCFPLSSTLHPLRTDLVSTLHLSACFPVRR